MWERQLSRKGVDSWSDPHSSFTIHSWVHEWWECEWSTNPFRQSLALTIDFIKVKWVTESWRLDPNNQGWMTVDINIHSFLVLGLGLNRQTIHVHSLVVCRLIPNIYPMSGTAGETKVWRQLPLIPNDCHLHARIIHVWMILCGRVTMIPTFMVD